MVEDGEVLVSTATAVEVLIVAAGKGDDIYQHAVEFLKEPFIALVDLDQEQLWAADVANRRYGRGRHPAALNFGDTLRFLRAGISAGVAPAVQGQRLRTDGCYAGGVSSEPNPSNPPAAGAASLRGGRRCR